MQIVQYHVAIRRTNGQAHRVMDTYSNTQMKHNPTVSLREAKERAEAIDSSRDYEKFVEITRKRFPWHSQIPLTVLERDYLRVVDHHLQYLIPHVQRYVGPNIRRVLDFGCGSGGSAIALAMVCPEVYFYGTDVNADEIAIAHERAKLYNVADRCEFHHIGEGQSLPFSDGYFDFCQCSSVLEYVLDIKLRRFCVQEMVRLVNQQGLLFFSVPNRLYPFEIHRLKWGWNYFPKWFKATTVDSSFWEVRKLARPTALELHRTPIVQLFRPWSNFCLKKKD